MSQQLEDPTRHLDWFKRWFNREDLTYETEVDPEQLKPILSRVIEELLPKSVPAISSEISRRELATLEFRHGRSVSGTSQGCHLCIIAMLSQLCVLCSPCTRIEL